MKINRMKSSMHFVKCFVYIIKSTAELSWVELSEKRRDDGFMNAYIIHSMIVLPSLTLQFISRDMKTVGAETFFRECTALVRSTMTWWWYWKKRCCNRFNGQCRDHRAYHSECPVVGTKEIDWGKWIIEMYWMGKS